MNKETKWMKTNLLQISLYIIGGVLIVISGFMEFSTIVVPADSDIQFESIQLNGFNSSLWLVYFYVAIVLTFIAYRIDSVGMKATYYFFLVLGGLLTAYVKFISGPIPPSLNNGSIIGFIGLLIFVITHIVFIPRKYYTRAMNSKQSLIVFGIYALLLSCVFLPYEISEDSIKNGIDHNDFFIFWIFGLLLLFFGFRKTLMSKILTFTIVGLSIVIFYNFHRYDYLYQNRTYAIGAYIAMTSYLSLTILAIYVLFRKKKNDLIT